MRIEGHLLPGGKVGLKFSLLNGSDYNTYLTEISITTSERNQEATLCLQELISTLLSQRLSQVHLLGSTSPDYQSLPQFISICKSSQTISYPLLFYVGRRVLHLAVTNSDTIHPQAMYLLENNSLD